MDIREATAEDAEGIRTVARASLSESYGHMFDEDVIEDVVEAWYGDGNLADELQEEGSTFIVALDNGEVVGFAQCYLVKSRDTFGEIDWLHIHPDARGAGLGTQLLRRAEETLLDRGAERLEGRVLAGNEDGTTFYEDHGFEATGERTVDIAGESYPERIYTQFPDDESGQVLTEAMQGPDGESIYVAYDEADRGSTAPFFAGYLDEGREERYGFFCSNCESFDVAMDAMGRVECNNCGNKRKPSRWDASYL